MAKSRNKEAYDRNPALYVIAAFVFVILLMFARHHPSQRTSSTSVVKGVKGSKQGIQDEIGNARKEDNVFARVKTFNSAASELQAVLKSYWNNGTALDKSFCFENLNAEGMEFIGKKIARAIKYQRPLIVAVIGSSVAAGHDNCQYDSMESQLQRTLSSIFEPIGVSFEVRNAGEGGGCSDTMENQVFCVRHMVGDDADFVVYSWSYFELGGGLDLIHESFVRWSLMMERAPSPILWYPNGCATGPTTYDRLFRAYGKYGFDVLCMTRGVEAIQVYTKGQTGVTGSPSKRGFWGAVGDGLHNVTRYGEDETGARRQSLGVMYRNWHPGPLGFQASADAYAWRLLKAAFRAVEMYPLTDGSESISEHPRKLTALDLGENQCTLNAARPYWISPAMCDHVPACINHELPTYGKPQVTYAKANDNKNPFQHVFSASVDEYLAGPSKLIPREEKDIPGLDCAHHDFCRAFHGDFMTYKFPPLAVGFITACFIQGKKEDYPNLSFYLNDRQLIQPEPNVLFAKNKCHVLQTNWTDPGMARESFYVSINMTSASTPHVSHFFGV